MSKSINVHIMRVVTVEFEKQQMIKFLLLTDEPGARRVGVVMGWQFIQTLSSWAARMTAQAKPCLPSLTVSDAIRHGQHGTAESLRSMDRNFAGVGDVSSIYLPKLGTETRKGRRPG
jgi:hypothetical protein